MLDATLVHIGRLIGKPPGWERVVRALAPPARFANSGVQPTAQPDGYVFPVDRGTLIGWSVHFFGAYEPEVRAEIRRRLVPGAIAIDVGANVGWHALLMATCVGTTGRVYAFEPNESTRRRLASAIDANGLAHVTVDPRGVAEREGPAGFVAPPAGHVWDGTGHLTAETSPKGSTIECTTLDAFAAERRFDRLALVKIDVEGWELSVLRGARQTLARLRPAVIFEYDPAYVVRSGASADALMQCWSDADYEICALDPRHPPVVVAGLGDRGGNFLALPREAR
jgi:FkbM family methyltransferase